MRTLSVFEYGLIEPLTGTEKNLLDQLRGPRNERLFDVGWRETRATSFVGVVQLPQTTLQVLPKMYRRVLDGRNGPPGRPSGDQDAVGLAVRRAPPDPKEREATANLLFLLSYTRKLDVTEPEISRLTEQRAPFSEILFWIFAHRLWDAVHREILRGYVTIEDRLDVLKGRWLVAAQARKPSGWRRDRFDVAYDEFTEDNLPNRLFKATVHRLSRWSQWTDTRRHLTQLRAVFADVADVTPQPHDFDQAAQWLLRHRRRANEGHLYRPLLKLAQMFWTGTGPQPSSGRTETFAFLFDMNQLFEEFIAEFIRRELREVWQSRGWIMRVQRQNRACLWYEAGHPRFWLHPDVRFVDEEENSVLILDTKYKELTADRKKWVSDEDARQMYAYSRRFDCPRVVLLYPQFAETIVADLSAAPDSPPWLEVRTVDLRENLGDSANKQVLRQEVSQVLTKGNCP